MNSAYGIIMTNQVNIIIDATCKSREANNISEDAKFGHHQVYMATAYNPVRELENELERAGNLIRF